MINLLTEITALARCASYETHGKMTVGGGGWEGMNGGSDYQAGNKRNADVFHAVLILKILYSCVSAQGTTIFLIEVLF